MRSEQTFGIQIDISSAAKKQPDGRYQDIPSCDHDCPYCPSALGQNKNLGRKSFLSVKTINKALETTAAGIKLTCNPGVIEANLFGTPEMHPDLPQIIQNTKDQGLRVVVTMTGRTAKIKPVFFEEILQAKPDKIALSYDGDNVKSQEAVYAARIIGNRISLLFNVVLHPENLDKVPEIIQFLQKNFPLAGINPYPEQAGFMGKSDPFINCTKQLKTITDWLINQGFNVDYFQKYLGLGPEFFHCWEPNKMYWLQIASAPPNYTYTDPFHREAFFNCYWNPHTVWDKRPLNQMCPEDVAKRITHGVEIDPTNPNICPGCAMPRLAIL